MYKDIKEAIDLLEAHCKSCRERGSGYLINCQGNLPKCRTFKVLALLCPLAEEPSQSLRIDIENVIKILPHRTNLEYPDGEDCKGADENCPKCLLQAALSKHSNYYQAEEPEAGDFTKRFRDFIKLSEEHLSKSKIGRLRTYGKESCKIIDRQAAELKKKQDVTEYERLLDKHIEAVKHIHCLWGDLDAECRVSQMLLAEQKKLKAEITKLKGKQDAEEFRAETL